MQECRVLQGLHQTKPKQDTMVVDEIGNGNCVGGGGKSGVGEIPRSNMLCVDVRLIGEVVPSGEGGCESNHPFYFPLRKCQLVPASSDRGNPNIHIRKEKDSPEFDHSGQKKSLRI